MANQDVQQSVVDIQSIDDDVVVGTLPNGDTVVTSTDSVKLADD